MLRHATADDYKEIDAVKSYSNPNLKTEYAKAMTAAKLNVELYDSNNELTRQLEVEKSGSKQVKDQLTLFKN